MTGIEARGLRRAYAGHPPVAALDGLDLSIADGGLTAVLGPSGCGKTTLLRCLAGTERIDAGSIDLGPRRLAGAGVHVRPERRRIGLVPQDGALFPHLDVAGNIAFGLRGRPRGERRARVRELLDLVSLGALADRRPHQLSGGQQQRVALARALAPRPEVVLLDEPFSALDTLLRAQLRDEVVAVLRQAGTTAVLVTHDQTEALSLADHVALMRDGRIVQAGTPIELYRRPVDLWAAHFLGDAIVLPGRRAGTAHVETALGRLPVAPSAGPDGPDVAAMARPEQIRRADPDRTPARALVVRMRFRGHDADVTLRVDGITFTARWPSTELPEVGDVVAVAVTGPVVTFPPPSTP